MARIFVADHPSNQMVQISLTPDSGGIVQAREDVLEEVTKGEYFQPLLDDVECRFASLIDLCFEDVGSLDAKARLQIVIGALASLQLKFEEK